MLINIYLILFMICSLHSLPKDKPRITDSLLKENIGFIVLKLENAPPEAFELLDAIIKTASNDAKSLNEPEDFLRFFFNTIRFTFNIKYQKNDLPGAGLKNRTLDCDNLALIYLSMAEELELPLHMVILPTHAFVRWEDKNVTIDWESIIGEKREKNFYKSSYEISDYAEKKGTYLRNLTRNEVIAFNLSVIGKVLLYEGNNKLAMEYMKEACKNAFRIPSVISARVEMERKIGNPGRALSYADDLLRLDSTDFEFYNEKAQILSEMGNNKKALQNFDISTQINPYQPEVYLRKFELDTGIFENIEKAYLIDNTNHYIAERYAVELNRKGFFKKSLMIWNKLISENPFNPQLYAGRAVSNSGLGYHFLAINDAESAKNLGLGKREYDILMSNLKMPD